MEGKKLRQVKEKGLHFLPRERIVKSSLVHELDVVGRLVTAGEFSIPRATGGYS